MSLLMEEGSSKYTIDEALVAMGFGNFQALALVYAGMGWVAEAMEMMLLSYVGPAIQSEWKLSSHEESLLTSVVFVGMLVGAYSWGVVSDRHGRRYGFLITALVTGCAGFFSALAPNYISLIALRCLVGVGLGGGHVLLSWFLEFIPAPNRGTWMVIFSAFWTLGTIFEASMAWIIMPSMGWRWLLVLSSLPSFILLIFYGVVPESPRYLCLKGRTADAQQVLELVAKVNKMELPSGKLVSDHGSEATEKFASEDAHLISLKKCEHANSSDDESCMRCFSSLFILLSPKLAKSTLLLWMVFFGNAFSYYGLVLLTSELSNRNSKCTPKTVHSGASSDGNLYRDVFVTSFAEIPGLLLSAASVDRFGRKLTMSTMFFVGCIFLLPLLFDQSQVLTTTLLFGARVCITGAFTVVYIYAPEIYPTSVRTTGVGIASSVGRIGGMICPLAAISLIHGCHQTMSIMLFELVLLFSGIAVLIFPLETSGRELSET